MLIIKNKFETIAKKSEPNVFEVSKNIAHVQLKKKNGTTVDTKIDVEDLKKVLDAGTWFAEWHKDFNSYLAQHFIGGAKQKQSLHAFILDVDSRTPIKHLNGDTLDNRKSNLEIYNRNSYNDYKELDGETVAVILRDSKGAEVGKTIIDKTDLYRVMNNGYAWVYYKSKEQPHAIANTPAGRLYLDRFIMNATDDCNIYHINLNTLDNRKSNLEIRKKSEE